MESSLTRVLEIMRTTEGTRLQPQGNIFWTRIEFGLAFDFGYGLNPSSSDST